MLVRTLGVTGSASGPRSPASTYLFQVKAADVAAGIAAGTVPKGIPVRDWSVIVDIGQGGFGLLERHVRAHDIDAVAISHFHADHFSDICSFYVHLKYHPVFGYAWSGIGPYIPVWGPSEIESHLSDSCCSIDSSNGDMAFLPNGWVDQVPVNIGPITIIPYKVWHSVESFGMRIIGPSAARGGETVTISYSGDTDYCDAVVDLARNADLFLCEASYIVGRDDKAPAGIHLTGKGAGRVAREAAAKKLVLVHIPSWNNPATSLAEAKEEYHGPIEVAKCNGVFEL